MTQFLLGAAGVLLLFIGLIGGAVYLWRNRDKRKVAVRQQLLILEYARESGNQELLVSARKGFELLTDLEPQS